MKSFPRYQYDSTAYKNFFMYFPKFIHHDIAIKELTNLNTTCCLKDPRKFCFILFYFSIYNIPAFTPFTPFTAFTLLTPSHSHSQSFSSLSRSRADALTLAHIPALLHVIILLVLNEERIPVQLLF